MKHFDTSSCCTSPTKATYMTITPPNVPIPNAPRMRIIPLPSHSVSLPSSISPSTDDLYPLALHLAHLSSLQQSKLEDILLTSPIQIRTPTVHIGTLYGGTPGETISALDAFITLKTLIPAGSIPPLLPSTIQTAVEIPCTRRCRESPVGSAQKSLLGGWSYRDISGCGSLSEGSNVWGFEACYFGGNSVIHLE